jgi:hypothetical protein
LLFGIRNLHSGEMRKHERWQTPPRSLAEHL